MDDVAEVARWAKGIERVHECIAGRFRRPEPRRRALESGVPFGWVTGDEGVQHLLSNDRADLRDDLRDYVVEHLGESMEFWWWTRRDF